VEWKTKFVENLKEIRTKITPQLFLYLEMCNDREQILAAIEAVLDDNYNEDLDWLYSTLKPVYTTEKFLNAKIVSPEPAMHTFQYLVSNEAIVVNINDALLREYIMRAISLDLLSKFTEPSIVLAVLTNISILPIKVGEIK